MPDNYNGENYTIGDYAFYNCSNLTSITIPGSVTSIGNYAFNGCTALKELRIEDSTNTLSLGYNYYNSSYTGIGLFYDCPLETLYVGRNLSYNTSMNYGYSPFYNKTTLTSLTIGDKVTGIYDYAFRGCSNLTSITIPDSVTSIGEDAFNGCKSLTSITIPNSVTSIGNYAFYNCSNLASITIPGSVTSIGNYAFNGSTALKELRIEDSTNTLSLGYNSSNSYSTGKGLFYDCPLETLYVGRNLSYNTSQNYGYSPFYNKTTLTSLTIGDKVTGIYDYAFRGCSNLTSITIPNRVTSIGESTFDGTAWYNNQPDGVVYAGKVLYKYKGTMSVNTNVNIKDGTLSITSSAFRGCTSLNSISIPNSVISIGDSAFYGCAGLASVTIPNSVTSIGEDAFYGCVAITNITIPNSITSVGYRAFYGCSGLTDITIGCGVTSIGSRAFYNCTSLNKVINYSNLGLTKGSTNYGYVAYYANKVINAPNGSIEGDFAFAVLDGANIFIEYLGNKGEVILPDSYKGEKYTIGANVFKNNTAITSITIPNSVTSIGEDAFYGCVAITNITIPNSVTSIGERAFDGTAWYNNQPDGVVYAGKVLYKYKGTMLANTNLNIKDGTLSITSSAFRGCTSLNSISIPNSVTSIGDSAFYNCSNFTSITIPGSVTSIGKSAFYGCSGLTDITIGYGVTSIGDYAFYNCSNFTSITIPGSVRSIGSSAFYNCTSLKEVHITDITAWCNIDFSSYNSNPLYYAKNLYLNDELVTGLVISSDVTAIKNYSFYNCSNLTSITIPNSVTSIGNYAFRGCSNLPNITIPNSVTSIGDYAFEDCSGLTGVTIPNSLTSIGNHAFNRCKNLKTVINYSNFTFSEGSFSYGDIAYYANKVINAPGGTADGDFVWATVNGVSKLCGYIGNDTDITLPDNYNGEKYTIGYKAFYNCSNLASITIPGSVTSIDNYVFNGCTALKELRIEDSTNTLSLGYNYYNSYSTGKGLFYDCPLETLYVGRNLSYNTSMNYGYSPFYNKTTLISLTIGDNVTSIGDYAFNGCTALKELRIEDSTNTLSLGYNYYNSSSTGKGLFYDCPLETLYVGRNLLYNTSMNYGYSPFYNKTTLTSLTIGDNVTSIGEDAFYGCTSLKRVTIPNSVTSIGGVAFYNCDSLKEVINFSNFTFTKGSEDYGYVAYYADKVINVPNGSIDGDFVFDSTNTMVEYLGNGGELLLPDNCKGENYAIGANVFQYNTAITGVTLPASVTSIGSDAFHGCTNLKSVYNFSNIFLTLYSKSHGYVAYYASTLFNVPGGSIEGDYVFTTIDGIPTLSYYIGSSTILTLPANYQGRSYTIADEAFKSNTKITTITIPAAVTTIGTKAFESCTGLKTVTLQGHTTTIEDYAFNKCSKLTSVHTPSLEAWCSINFTNPYSNPLFYAQELYVNDEPLTTLVIPTTITEIKNNTFYNCTTLETADLPRGLTTIGENAFRGCSNLTTATIPNTVVTIGKYAYYDCTGLTSLTSYIPGETLPTLSVDSYTFLNVSKKKCTLTVPIGSRSTYASSSGWKDFKTIVETENTAIEEITPSPSQQYIFDLKGNPVTTPLKGNIYIINGRKVVL